MNDYFYAITGWFSPRGTRSVYRDWRLRHLYYNLLRTAESFTLPRCQRILCLSTVVQDALRRRYGIPADRLPVVPYGISEGPADSRPLPKAGPTILFAGGNFQRKGLAVLMLASPRILQAIPTARFIILGDSRDDRLIRRLCRRTGVAEAFQFLGAVDYPTLYRYYRTADVFVMPSLLEAFGLPYLEAMQCGLPVVASDVPGPSDFLVNGVNALTPAVGDAGQLAAAVLQALTDYSLRRRLIRNGRATAEQFTVRRMAEQTLAVYQAVGQAGATGAKTVL